MPQPLSSKSSIGGYACCLVVAIMGCLLYLYFHFPFLKIGEAAGWKPTPCTITACWEGKQEGADWMNVYYSYHYGGSDYLGRKYYFLSVPYPWPGATKAFIAHHPIGAARTCYVNPANPAEAVLYRGFAMDLWGPFFAIALIGLCAWGIHRLVRFEKMASNDPWKPMALRKAARPKFEGVIDTGPEAPAPTRRLKPKTAGYWVTGVIIGSVAFFFLAVVNEDKPVNIFDAFFLDRNTAAPIAWALFSVALVPAVYFILLRHNTRVQFDITPGLVSPGKSFTVEWKVRVRTDKFTNFEITLQGREEATYTVHTGRRAARRTDTHTFWKIPIVNLSDPAAFAAGKAVVDVPYSVMHSFESTDNKITWWLCANATIPLWPDLSEKYPVLVLPMGKTTAAPAAEKAPKS